VVHCSLTLHACTVLVQLRRSFGLWRRSMSFADGIGARRLVSGISVSGS
jgi:hypothetical protein